MAPCRCARLLTGQTLCDIAVDQVRPAHVPRRAVGAPVAVSASPGPLFLRFTRDALTGRERRGPHPERIICISGDTTTTHLRTRSGDDPPGKDTGSGPSVTAANIPSSCTHAEVTEYLGSLAWVEVCRSTNYQVAHGADHSHSVAMAPCCAVRVLTGRKSAVTTLDGLGNIASKQMR